MNRKLINCVLIFFATCFAGCSLVDKTDSVDIKAYNWQLCYIETPSEKMKVSKFEDYKRKYAYLLRFDSDSVFFFDNSVNDAQGEYEINEKGSINIYFFGEVTEVGGGNEMDIYLIQKLASFNEYKLPGNKLRGNKLHLYSNSDELVFKQVR